MLKNPIIKTLLVVNLLVLACLSFGKLRDFIRDRQQQERNRIASARFVAAADKKADQSGEFSLTDNKRLWAIGANGSKVTNAQLEWLLSLMDKMFQNGKPFGVDQWFRIQMCLLYYKGDFSSEQKDIIFRKCSTLLSNQTQSGAEQNPYIIETCCFLFGQTCDQRAVPYLTPLLQNPNGRVKVVAARALTRLGHPMKIPNGGFGNLPNK